MIMKDMFVLAFVLFACFWFSNCCNRHTTISCSDYAQCSHRSSRSTHSNEDLQEGSAELNKIHYSIKLQTDPCDFNTYDMDMDGEITKGELHAVIGIDEETNDLFADINIKQDDGVIKPDEFCAMSRIIITECVDSDKS